MHGGFRCVLKGDFRLGGGSNCAGWAKDCILVSRGI